MARPIRPPRLFIGSSSEGKEVARNLQSELGDSCEVERWDQNVFEPSGFTLESLLRVADTIDFAVLIATPDDTMTSRGATQQTARDNILLEFGLFAGALGRQRVYLLATDEHMRLPTDLLGLTRLPYRARSDGNERAAVSDAALEIEKQFRAHGPVVRDGAARGSNPIDAVLEQEIALLCANADAQGWIVKNTTTTLRLRSPKGKPHGLTKSTSDRTREALRRFAAELRANGLRVSQSLLRPIDESPFQ